jgi:glycine/D-amino acid oxidase-like deaminating enzyme
LKLDQADVVVVGGGIVGVTTAWFLRRRGLDVVLVEQRELAHGASGRNPGFLWLHCRNPGIALELARAGAALYEEEFLPLLGSTFEYRRRGGMIYFFTEAQRRVFQEFVAARRRDGLAMELLDAKAAREAAPILPETVLGATYCPEDGQIRTPTFVRLLGDACRKHGVRIYEGTAALGLLRTGARATGVRTAAGDIHAASVIWAAGVWTAVLGDEAGLPVPVRPERLGVVQTAPLPRLLDKVIYGPLAAKQYELIRTLPSYRDEDFRDPLEDPGSGLEHLELMAQTEDGSLLLGCPMDYPDRLDARPTARGLHLTLQAFLAQWPQYAGVGIERVWAGLLPFTADSLPIVGEAPGCEGLVIATGHVFGNVAGPITGRLVAELVAGDPPTLPLDDLRPDRPQLRSKSGVVRW